MKQFFILLIALSFVLSACASPSSDKQNPIEISNAWVRTVGGMQPKEASAPATGMQPKEDAGPATGAFMTIKNNSDAADKLIKAESDAAKMVQIHLSEVDANGVATMHEVDGVDIPAGGSAELKPGSYHVMLIGLKQDIKEGDTISITLVFQNAGKVTLEAPVKNP
ncbi:MAG: copper chaperone PCu(A)C [Chloroflexi bacterium]|nr:MAG: copper chaperone PCu(A)C [Chloroflexota bacterium]